MVIEGPKAPTVKRIWRGGGLKVFKKGNVQLSILDINL